MFYRGPLIITRVEQLTRALTAHQYRAALQIIGGTVQMIAVGFNIKSDKDHNNDVIIYK